MTAELALVSLVHCDLDLAGTHETQRTDFGRERGGSTDFTTGGAEVDDLHFIGILARPVEVSFVCPMIRIQELGLTIYRRFISST